MQDIFYNFPDCKIIINSPKVTIQIDGETLIFDDNNYTTFDMKTGLFITEYTGLFADQNSEFSWAKAIFHPNGYSRPHHHKEHIEDYYVISGQATIRVNNHTKILKPGDHITIMPNEFHHIVNTTTSENMVLIVRSIPAWTVDDYHLLD